MKTNSAGLTRVVIYARYSSENQRDESIEDQLEVCRRYIDAQGWQLVHTYTDAAMSGASRFRPGFLALTADANRRQFDVVVCEAVDRLGRRLADTADLQDTLAFHNIRLFTPCMGEITAMHVAIMGMMAQMALKDLGEKTKRGQLGRVLKGRMGGGLAYGYRIVTLDNPSDRGARSINDQEAEIVRRVFTEYANDVSPEAIVKTLNREGVPGPGGHLWSNTTIRGQADRGTGILNNAVYTGLLEWNRCSYVKDPRTGRRVARPNPPDKWERVAVPELRIVDDALWAKVKARQEIIRDRLTPTRRDNSTDGPERNLNGAHRIQFLLSGLLRCGCCGGGYTVIGKDRYGCATRRQKGTCENSRTITRQHIEERVLTGLKDRLLEPGLLAGFIEGFQAEMAEQQKRQRNERADHESRLADIERKMSGILKAIEDGMYNPGMKTRMADLEAEKAALLTIRVEPDDKVVSMLTHPRLADLYRRKVSELELALEKGADRAASMSIIRSMVDAVVLTPRADRPGLDATLHGDLAAILAACAEIKQKQPSGEPESCQLSVVAGAGFEPATFRL